MADKTKRSIRFYTLVPISGGPQDMIASAKQAEKLGYATFGVADHFMLPMAPLIVLQAIADATSTLRLTMTMLDQDFRHPAVLAKELATIDVLSGGRLEVGIGAGYLKADYEQSGIPFDKASVRIERLEEQAIILKGLFAGEPFGFEGKHYRIDNLVGSPTPVQRPRPPIMIGGGGPKLLAVAGRQADIVEVTSPNTSGTMSIDPSAFTAKVFEEKIGWVREAAGDRFAEIELSTMLMGVEVCEDQRAGIQAVLQRLSAIMSLMGGGGDFEMSEKDVLESPSFAIGTLDQVCEKLLWTRERFGFSYFGTGFSASPQTLVPIMEALRGK